MKSKLCNFGRLVACYVGLFSQKGFLLLFILIAALLCQSTQIMVVTQHLKNIPFHIANVRKMISRSVIVRI